MKLKKYKKRKKTFDLYKFWSEGVELENIRKNLFLVKLILYFVIRVGGLADVSVK